MRVHLEAEQQLVQLEEVLQVGLQGDRAHLCTAAPQGRGGGGGGGGRQKGVIITCTISRKKITRYFLVGGDYFHSNLATHPECGMNGEVERKDFD